MRKTGAAAAPAPDAADLPAAQRADADAGAASVHPARRLRPRIGADISPAPPRSLRLSVRTSDFQSGKRGSTPLGPTKSAASAAEPYGAGDEPGAWAGR